MTFGEEIGGLRSGVTCGVGDPGGLETFAAEPARIATPARVAVRRGLVARDRQR